MSGTFDLFVSDHQPVFLIKKNIKIKHPTFTFSGRTYRNYNQNTMQEKLDQILDSNRNVMTVIFRLAGIIYLKILLILKTSVC